MALRMAEDIVRSGRVPLTGLLTSPGIQNPGDFIYLLAPIVWLNRDPSVASAAVGLLNVAAVGGTVLLGWRIFSPLGGLVAGLAYATNPWAVFYARKVWNPDSVAPWAVLLFVALDQAIVANRWMWAAATFPIFAIGVQMHFSMGVLAPLLLAPVVVLLRHRRWLHLAFGLGAGVLVTAPYLTHVFQTSGAEVQTLQSILARPEKLDAQGASFVAGLTAGWEHWYLLNIHLEHLLPGRVAASTAKLESLLLGVGLLVALVLTLMPHITTRRDRHLRLAGLLLWLLLPPLLTIRHTLPIYEHYFVIVLPAAALLVAAGVCWLADRPARWGRPLLGLALASLIAVASIQTMMVVRLLDYVAVAYEPNYGPPLARTATLARELVGIGATDGSRRLAVEVAGGDREPLAYLVRPFYPNLEVVGVGQVGVYPGPGLGIVPETRPLDPWLGEPQGLDLSYVDGVTMLSAVTSQRGIVGDRLGLAMTWSVSDAGRVPAAGVLWEVSLHDKHGGEIARKAGIRHDPSTIGPGEPIVSWFSLGLPPDAAEGRYQLRLRRLHAATGEPLVLTDSVGHAVTEWRSKAIDVRRRR